MSVMSLHPHPLEPVPEETARVARGAFPKGHPYLTFRDALGTIFQDEDLPSYSQRGGNRAYPRGVSRWLRSFSFGRTWRIARQLRPFARASTGSNWWVLD